MVLRVALIYVLLDCKLVIGKDGVVSPVLSNLSIRIEHLEAALAVWDSCERSALMLSGGKPGDPLSEKILRLLESGPMTRDQFNDHLSPKQKGQLASTLAKLEVAGQVRKEKKAHQGPGRPSEVWQKT
jgi:hypothetical protein